MLTHLIAPVATAGLLAVCGPARRLVARYESAFRLAALAALNAMLIAVAIGGVAAHIGLALAGVLAGVWLWSLGRRRWSWLDPLPRPREWDWSSFEAEFRAHVDCIPTVRSVSERDGRRQV
jgi:hypothetical protein